MYCAGVTTIIAESTGLIFKPIISSLSENEYFSKSESMEVQLTTIGKLFYFTNKSNISRLPKRNISG
jgi:hypothetical protein